MKLMNWGLRLNPLPTLKAKSAASLPVDSIATIFLLSPGATDESFSANSITA